MDSKLGSAIIITMETLKLMLRNRGLSTDTSEPIESDFPAVVTKIGAVCVFMSNRARINEKDIDTILGISQKAGGNLAIVVVPIAQSDKVLDAIRQKSALIQIFHLGQLQFDILTHRKVPPHRILNAEERDAFMKKFHITNVSAELPKIDSQDAVARWIGAKPGDIIEILRKSDTAGTTPYYRECVADTSLHSS
jgi:DNA-directed RNA polymerase subunit H (RpoH/RPB5)